MKNNILAKLIWRSSKKDLLFGIPWLPLYSLCEVGLGLGAAILLQLVFLDSDKISAAGLLPGKFKDLFPANFTFDRKELIYIIPIIISIIAFGKFVSGFMSSYLVERAGHRAAHSVREEMLKGFLSSPGNKLDQVNPDYIANQMMQDSALLQGAMSKGTISAFRDSFVLIGIIFSMLLISWKSFLIGAFIVAIVAWMLKKVAIKLNYYTREGQKNQIELSTRFLLTHSGALTVNSLRAHQREFDDLENLNEKNYQLMNKSLFVRTAFSPITEFFAICIVALLFSWRLNSQGSFHSGEYTSIFILLAFSIRYIKNIAGTITFFSDVHVVLDRINEYIQSFSKKVTFLLPEKLSQDSRHAIIVENVNYQVNDGDQFKNILENCSLKIEKGKKIAFIGESGAGKTSLLRIIAGLVYPSQGKVSIIPEFLLASQSPYVFRGTVKENIVYVQKDLPENVMDHKCKELILGLMLAYSEMGTNLFLEKQLGFLGDGLSGGEKARVSLARVLFSQPKLILLDEPTANLDAKSSQLFWEAIDTWKKKDSEHTVVAVSHALHEVMDFDYCYVFEQGKITKAGLPREIIQMG